MNIFQIWSTTEKHSADSQYAISPTICESIPPSTRSTYYVTSLDCPGFQKICVIKSESRAKEAFIDYLKPLLTTDGIHPIYNKNGNICQQIVNVPRRILSSDEILEYLNTYTVLPQETPPYQEIIFKLTCYSEKLTNEYYDSTGFSLENNRRLSESQTGSSAEEDKDSYYFACRPKESEGKRGTVFHYAKLNQKNQQWIILEDYYDYLKNAWIKNGKALQRNMDRVGFPIEPKKHDFKLIQLAKAKSEYYKDNPAPKTSFDWRKLEIHDLANMIPHPLPEERERLKKDIGENGVLEPIWLYEGKILDGRTRYGICLEFDIKPDFRAFKGPGSAKSFVVSMGINRRHLSKSQIAAIGVDLYLGGFEIEARERNRTNSKMPTKNFSEAQKGEAADLLADYIGTNKLYISQAKKIKNVRPDLFEKIIDGDLSLSQANRQIVNFMKPIKKRRFEDVYRNALEAIIEKNIITNDLKIAIIMKLTHIYLKWNKRNNKKVLGDIDRLKKDFPDIFSAGTKPHLQLLEN